MGEAAALLAAGVWAGSSMLWARLGEKVRPMLLNLVKGVIALVMLTPLVVVADWAGFDRRTLLLFAVSGVVGIGIGDTFYFRSLNALGPTRALLLLMIAPPATVLGGWLTLGERINLGQGLGIAVTLAGVAWVITHRPPTPGDDGTTRPPSTGGIIAGIAAAVLAAGAILINRAAFGGRDDLSVPATTFVRLLAGVVALAVLLPLVKPPAGTVPLRKQGRGIWPMFVLATFLGTFLGLLLMQAAVGSRTDTGVVQTLLATSPLFVLPLTALAGERVTARSVVGATVAVAGIGLLFAAAPPDSGTAGATPAAAERAETVRLP